MPLKTRSILIVSLLLIFGMAISIAANRKESAGGFIKPITSPLVMVGHYAGEEILNPNRIAGLADDRFETVHGVPTFGFSDKNHWLKFRVFNLENNEVKRLIEVNSPILNVCNLYEINGPMARRLYESGDEKSFKERPISHLSYLFPVNLQPNSSREFLLEVSTRGEQLQVPLKLWEEEELIEREETDRLLRGIYFGIILFVLIFNFFLYLIIREKSSMWYVLYVYALLMLQLSLGGFAFKYFWPSSIYLANVANPFFASISIFALIRFTQSFLTLDRFYQKLNRIYHYAGVFVAVNSLLALVYTPFFFKLSVLSINVVALLLNILILPTVILVLKKNFRPARYFLLAFIILVGSVFFFILNNFGLLYSDFYAAYGLLIGSAAEVILLSFAIVDKFKIFREEAFLRLQTINNMKAKANEVLELKVKKRTRKIFEQKQVVEKQKDEILSSIRYAERIQSSMLPSENLISELFPDHFILFKPRDIVSGDFYWFNNTKPEFPWMGGGDWHLFAAVDCTGHGVPGAMMSMLGYQALEQSLSQPGVKSPADALDYINREVIHSLSHNSHSQLRDGMDMVLCAYSQKKRKLVFAGAKNDLYLLRDREFIRYRGDRISIGSEESIGKFSNQYIELIPGDRIYTFTDGFPDQFGGPERKKLKAKNLLDAILGMAHKSMPEQNLELIDFLKDWKNKEEQVDDICLIGVEIK